MIDRIGQRVPGELDPELDAERPDAETASSFGEETPPVAEPARDPPDTGRDERVAAQPPSWRAVRHGNADGAVDRPAIGQLVASHRCRAVEGDLDPGQLFDAPAEHQRRAAAQAERIQAERCALLATAELDYVNERGGVAGDVVVQLARRARDIPPEQILEGVLGEVQRLRVMPVVADRDEMTPRLVGGVGLGSGRGGPAEQRQSEKTGAGAHVTE